MNKIDLEQIEIEGFMVYKTRQVFSFKDYRSGFYFISGENKAEPRLGANGAGKSVLFDALCWVLFGKTSRNLRAGNIISWGKTTCKVTLTFNDGQILCRQQAPNKLTLNSETKTQEEINQLLNTDFDPFLYSVVIAQRSTKFFELEPAEKLKVFTKIMDDQLQPWVVFSEMAKNKEDLTDALIQKAELVLAEIQGSVNSLMTTNYSDSINKWTIEQGLKKNEVQSEIKKVTDKIATGKISLTALEKKVKMANNDAVLANKVFDSTLAEKENQKALLAEEEKLLYADRVEVDRLTKDQTKFQNLTGVCSECGQPITKEHLKKELKKVGDKLKTITSQVSLRESSINELRQIVSKYTNKHLEAYKTLKIKEDEHNTLKQDHSTLMQTNEYNETTLKSLQKKLRELDEQENPFFDEEEKRQQKLVFFRRRQWYQSLVLEEYREQLEIFKYLKKGFKDIRLIVMKESLKEFEIQINNNLQQLGMADWDVFLDIEGETKKGGVIKGFTIMVQSPYNDKPVPFESWSGGESQRLIMAGTLGLISFIHSRRGSDWDIEVYDEPSQFLSEEGVEDLLENLYDRARSLKKKIFIIDHRSLNSRGEFDGTINIVKTKQHGSQIQ